MYLVEGPVAVILASYPGSWKGKRAWYTQITITHNVHAHYDEMGGLVVTRTELDLALPA